MKIREITQEQEIQDYQELCKYCFPNPNNWIDHMFPLQQDDIVFGGYQEEKLQSALISKSLTAYLFGKRLRMSGISAVTSAPEGRNLGCLRQVLKHTLQHELERGMLISSLYPFLFGFYEKMGYGCIGGAVSYTFKPEDIREFAIHGEFIPVVSPKQSEIAAQFHNHFVQSYDFGTEFQFDIQTYHQKLKEFSAYAYIYNNNGATRGYLEFRLTPSGPFSKKMYISRFGFSDTESLQALMAFIRSHRNQCCEITLAVPDNLELRPMFQEPRVKIEVITNWMARPLDVEAVLRLRLEQDPCGHEMIFSVQDPLIEQNTGTYKIHGPEVVKMDDCEKNSLAFPVFSSLLFNAFTFDQLYSAGRIDWFDADMAAYFSKKGDIYLSAAF